jgi:hypothetical protein
MVLELDQFRRIRHQFLFIPSALQDGLSTLLLPASCALLRSTTVTLNPLK